MREKFWQWLAGKLPKPLVYFAAVRLIAHATMGKHGDTIVPEIAAIETLGRWTDDYPVRKQPKEAKNE